jgi:hypothetical protein
MSSTLGCFGSYVSGFRYREVVSDIRARNINFTTLGGHIIQTHTRSRGDLAEEKTFVNRPDESEGEGDRVASLDKRVCT